MSDAPTSAIGSSNLSPIVVPDGPMAPQWAREAVARLNMLVGATIAVKDVEGGYGAGAFSFSQTNALLLLPLGGTTGRVMLAKLTGGGANGFLDIKNGIVVGFSRPT